MSAVTRRVGFPGSDRPAGQGLALACLMAAVARGDDSAVFRGAAETDGATADASSINLGLPQLLDGGLGADRRVVNLLESVGAGPGGDDRHDLDVPVVVVVNGFPITEGIGGMQAVGRGVQHEMET